jgi:hypothetical protein
MISYAVPLLYLTYICVYWAYRRHIIYIIPPYVDVHIAGIPWRKGVLWTTLDYWTKVGQPYTYWLYFAYLIASISMIISINNTKWLSRFVSLYLVLYLFSTIRYVVNIFSTLDTEPFVITDFKNLLITFFYASMWTWILFKLKREVLHKSLKK